jgi:hypothetical protein
LICLKQFLYFFRTKLAEDHTKYEEVCQILHSMTFPPARLPWIPVTESNRALAQLYFDSPWAKKTEPSVPTDADALALRIKMFCSFQMQRMNAATIAHYLPKRYV